MDDPTRTQHNQEIRNLLVRLDLHSPGERAHAERVAVYSVATGEALGLDDDALLTLRHAATLHDIGKIRLDRALLTKLGKIEESEMQQLRRHAALAQEMVAKIAWLSDAVPLIHHHHEWWNGLGYPDGLSGDQIPLGSRIIGLAEAFDVMSTAPGDPEAVEAAALREVQACTGSQFDPGVVAAFVAIQPRIQPIPA